MTSPFWLCQQPVLSGPRCLCSRLCRSTILLLISASPARPKTARIPHMKVRCRYSTSTRLALPDGEFAREFQNRNGSLTNCRKFLRFLCLNPFYRARMVSFKLGKSDDIAGKHSLALIICCNWTIYLAFQSSDHSFQKNRHTSSHLPAPLYADTKMHKTQGLQSLSLSTKV
jgi:hypothetical protein